MTTAESSSQFAGESSRTGIGVFLHIRCRGEAERYHIEKLCIMNGHQIMLFVLVFITVWVFPVESLLAPISPFTSRSWMGARIRASADDAPPDLENVFEGQFKATKTKDEVYGSSQYWKGKPYNKITVGDTDRNVVMKDFDKARVSILKDSIFVISIGFAVVWAFGTLKDVRSYGFGSILGLMYSLLLGRYVENLGTEGGGGGGSARFAPVILLIAAYGKFKTELNLVPELLGFFTYQVSSFLQAFNEDLYEDND